MNKYFKKYSQTLHELCCLLEEKDLYIEKLEKVVEAAREAKKALDGVVWDARISRCVWNKLADSLEELKGEK